MQAGADIAAVARLIANRPRAAMLDRMLDNGTHTAGDLAREAGIAPSTASAHLADLVDGGLVTVKPAGRQRRYRLAGRHVAKVLESLASIAPPVPGSSLRQVTAAEQLRAARTCYDHLAGRLGVAITDALVRRRALVRREEIFELTGRGELFFQDLGVDVSAARERRRKFASGCLDWTERKLHLGGALGAELSAVFFDHGWIERRPGTRALAVTPRDRTDLLEQLGVATSP